MDEPKEKTPGSGRKKGTPNKRGYFQEAGIRFKNPPLKLWRDILDGRKVRMPGTNQWHQPTFADIQWAAQQSAPYIHPKKAQKVEHGGTDGKPVKVEIIQFGKGKDVVSGK
jgi:hypothetical protein